MHAIDMAGRWFRPSHAIATRSTHSIVVCNKQAMVKNVGYRSRMLGADVLNPTNYSSMHMGNRYQELAGSNRMRGYPVSGRVCSVVDNGN